MTATPLLSRLRARLRPAGDAGVNLVELMVSMGIFVVLLSVCAGAIMTMTRTLGKSQGIADSSTEVRRAFDRMDRQMRYADALNAPILVGGTTWYVEFRTTADGDDDGLPTCTQWRLDTVTDVLEVRSWEVSAGGATGTTGWARVAGRIVNAPDVTSGQQPFTYAAAGRRLSATGGSPADSSLVVTTRQRLRVRLISTVGSRDAGTTESAVDFAARNSSTRSPTNPDADNDGAPDTSVCTEAGRP